LFDLAISLLLLMVMALPLLILALIIRCQLGSPVLFIQERPGLHGKPFKIFKLRTMSENGMSRVSLFQTRIALPD
jgi:sugar transferase EpsL